MKIEPFAMERMQSLWEHQVDINLSESGVQPLRLQEFLETRDLEALLGQELAYTQTNGTPELRAAIAGMYSGATIDHIEVTNGGSEANYITCWNLVEPGDEIVLMVPTYMQTYGLVRSFGARVRLWPLREGGWDDPPRWRADLDTLRALVNPRTKLIIICNPNNPTGARLDATDLTTICDVASGHGAWVLSDEVYRGAELDGQETPSIWGHYDRVIVTGGLSKAYGLPGLRIGWIVAPPTLITSLWSYHDYTTIAPSALSDHLARLALTPPRRARLLERTRSILRANYPVIREWLRPHGDAFSHIPPEAGAIAFMSYRHGINSTELVTRLRETESVLLVPGDHFNMDGYLRIGYGSDRAPLRSGLARLDRLLASISTHAPR